MGLGGISVWQLLIVLVIVLLIFGTKKLRGAGGDLGTAISNFKKSMKSPEEGKEPQEEEVAPEEASNEALAADATATKDKA